MAGGKYSKPHEFPFDILWVADKCGLLSGKKKPIGEEINVQDPHPSCNDKNMHLALNAATDLWHCTHCGEGGGMLHLYVHVFGGTMSHAATDLYRMWRGEPVAQREKSKAKLEIARKAAPSRAVASIENRDLCYQYVLGQCGIDKEDLSNSNSKGLLDRGMTLESIQACGYRTLPYRVNMQIPDEMVELTSDVAGFFSYKGKRFINTEIGGLLIPFRDLFGRIGMMQIRTRSGKTRYFSFSSGKPENGRYDCTRTVSTVHHVGINHNNVPKEICFTEGALKADVAHYLSANKKPFIAIAGVNNRQGLKEALELLKEHGLRKVIFSFDNDMYDESKPVLKNVKACATLVREIGLEVGMISWDIGMKGVDDYLFKQLTKKIGQDAISNRKQEVISALQHNGVSIFA